ncbi:hypothetical protein P7C70_g8610, partial [Phenoliferia sp. Uapishka_3]
MLTTRTSLPCLRNSSTAPRVWQTLDSDYPSEPLQLVKYFLRFHPFLCLELCQLLRQYQQHRKGLEEALAPILKGTSNSLAEVTRLELGRAFLNPKWEDLAEEALDLEEQLLEGLTYESDSLEVAQCSLARALAGLFNGPRDSWSNFERKARALRLGQHSLDFYLIEDVDFEVYSPSPSPTLSHASSFDSVISYSTTSSSNS